MKKMRIVIFVVVFLLSVFGSFWFINKINNANQLIKLPFYYYIIGYFFVLIINVNKSKNNKEIFFYDRIFAFGLSVSGLSFLILSLVKFGEITVISYSSLSFGFALYTSFIYFNKYLKGIDEYR